MARPLTRKANTRAECLGVVLTDLRTKNGVAGQQLADRVGCNLAHYYKVEKGTGNPTLKMLEAIADFHGVALSVIFRRAENAYKRRKH